MIRFWLFLLLVAAIALAVVGVSLWGDAGTVSIAWVGWRLDATAAWLAGVLGVVALLLALLWETTGRLAAVGRRAAAAREIKRQDRAISAATAGYAALTAGDHAAARTKAEEAARLTPDLPLIQLLQAQAAEANGDAAAAETAWAKVAATADLRPAGDAALARIAHARSTSIATPTPTALGALPADTLESARPG